MNDNSVQPLPDDTKVCGSDYTRTDQQQAKAFRVLSLDGGGIRGIYSAAFLDRLTTQFSRRRNVSALDIGRGFDLITGTSTGAIIGCALAVGRPMAEVVDLYRRYGPKIFPHRVKGMLSLLYRVTQGNGYVRAGEKALRTALKDVLGDKTMLDVFRNRGISLSIPAVLMHGHQSWVFKKSSCSGVRDDNYSLVDVCMATSAAPIYRSLAAINDPAESNGPKQVFADGGLWANNPIIVGLVDALKICEHDQPIEIFSLGTCPRPSGEFIDANSAHRSVLNWLLSSDVVSVSISAQEYAFDNIARLLASTISKYRASIRRLRFPTSPVPGDMMHYLGLDDTRKKAMDRLISQAKSDADLTLSVCDEQRDQAGEMINQLMLDLPDMPKTGAVWELDPL